MGKYILQRLISIIPIMVGVTIVIFLFMQLVPGDVATALLGPRATPEKVAEIREELGLNEPLYVQYFTWIWNVARGNLGRSIQNGVPVLELILPKFQNTIILLLGSLFLSVIGGLLLGITAAVRQNSIFDHFAISVAVVGSAMPTFWLALVLLFIFAVELRWFPAGGITSFVGGGGVVDVLRHLALPAVSAAAIPLAVISRLVRTSMLEALHEDYVVTLRAKGLPERLIVYGHALRNAMPAIVSITGLQAGFLLGGTLFTEVIFQWPGMGYQLWVSIRSSDIPVVQGAMIFVSFTFVLLNLFADIIVAYLDPQVREGQTKKMRGLR